VNITNIGESPRVHVQTTYVNINIVNVTYVNRTVGVSAMRQEDFAAGRSAHEAPVVVDVHVFEHPQVVEHIDIPPPAHPFAGHPPARPVQVRTERPAVINEHGKLTSGKPGVPPAEPPVKPAPQVRPLPGRTVVASPSGVQPSAKPAAPMTKPTPTPAPTAAPAAKPEEKAVKPPAPPAAPVKPATVPPAKPSAPAATPGSPATVKPSVPPVPPAKPATVPPAKPAAPAATNPPKNKKDEKKKENQP